MMSLIRLRLGFYIRLSVTLCGVIDTIEVSFLTLIETIEVRFQLFFSFVYIR